MHAPHNLPPISAMLLTTENSLRCRLHTVQCPSNPVNPPSSHILSYLIPKREKPLTHVLACLLAWASSLILMEWNGMETGFFSCIVLSCMHPSIDSLSLTHSLTLIIRQKHVMLCYVMLCHVILCCAVRHIRYADVNELDKRMGWSGVEWSGVRRETCLSNYEHWTSTK